MSILVPRSVRAAPAAGPRPEARGKFLACGGEKFYARGVTYGTFRPDANGDEFPPVDTVRRDFAQMAANGFNAVRTYTMPPTWLLDLAAEEGLYVAISLAAERSVGISTSAVADRSREGRTRRRAPLCGPSCRALLQPRQRDTGVGRPLAGCARSRSTWNASSTSP